MRRWTCGHARTKLNTRHGAHDQCRICYLARDREAKRRAQDWQGGVDITSLQVDLLLDQPLEATP